MINQIALKIMAEGDNISIIKIATEEVVKFFEADFGFGWGKFKVNDEYKIVYKSLNMNFHPNFPLQKNQSSIYKDIKSYITIPIHYFDHSYGSIVLCYKKKRDFSEEILALVETAGNIVAQSITINWLLENEQKALTLAEKQKATEILLYQEKLKNEFIANATHELRTPLAIMKGNIGLAKQGKAKSLQSINNIIDDIDEETDHLSAIISDLALLTSNSKQPDGIPKEKINLKSLVRDVIERCKSLAHKKNISIIAKNIPNINVFGNKSYLEKMLLNLVKNSVMYGNKNGLTEISINKSKKFITITVADNGVGISKDDLAHVFDRFYRGDKSHSTSGTGLGLAIVKWIAEAHGGSVNVKSALHKGATFSVYLPIKAK